MSNLQVLLTSVLVGLLWVGGECYRKKEDKTKCPHVKGARNFNLDSLLGSWYVVQYYATSEEDVVYKCMRASFSMPVDGVPEIDLNITYSFVDDPDNELLMGNITYVIPDPTKPAHWIHTEDPYVECMLRRELGKQPHVTISPENISDQVLETYNTHILDSDNNEWALLLNCAEKPKSPRYLTSLMISREPTLSAGVISFLRDKLPKYDITLDYMFEMKQTECEDPSKNLHYASASATSSKPKKSKHPLKRKTRSKNSYKRH